MPINSIRVSKSVQRPFDADVLANSPDDSALDNDIRTKPSSLKTFDEPDTSTVPSSDVHCQDLPLRIDKTLYVRDALPTFVAESGALTERFRVPVVLSRYGARRSVVLPATDVKTAGTESNVAPEDDFSTNVPVLFSVGSLVELYMST